jgi:gliding motility-associated lipoprotein GldK
MKKLYFLTFFIISAMLSSCGKGGAGELVGAYNKKFKNKKIPLGMVFIPPGRTLIGMTDEDISFYQGTPSRMTSFSAFYMDQTEITNAEYRQFVNWVRDSVAVTKYLSGSPELFITPKNVPAGTTPPAQKNINWKKVGNGSALWSSKKGGKYAAKLSGMYYPSLGITSSTISDKDIDIRQIKFSYAIKSLDREAEGRKNPNMTREDFYDIYTDNPDPAKPNHHPSVMVYPDTLVWKLDYSYTYNDPMVESYFNHPSYDKYPVVGVTWDQANAFCAWRTQFYESVARQRKLPKNSRLKYRLPTEQQFEYAARGGKTQTKYPWGGPYIKNAKGCMQANFKVGRGNYVDDGGLYTVDARAYLPNDFGLYNMAGNVAEWTVSAYNKSATTLLQDYNPNFTNAAKPGANRVLKRKVVRGGSWKDIGFFLQNSVASYEYQDQPRSYIGFRCVSDFPGNDLL